MNDSIDTIEKKQPTPSAPRASRRQALTTAALTLGAASLGPSGALGATPNPAAPTDESMKSFALIFRQGSRRLTDAELERRFEETRAWARHQNAAGHQLEPHMLAPEGQSIGPDGATLPIRASEPGAITALLFLRARDLAQATELTRTHPGLRTGASVEIRPWAPPPAAR
jgi:hypothetical protein